MGDWGGGGGGGGDFKGCNTQHLYLCWHQEGLQRRMTGQLGASGVKKMCWDPAYLVLCQQQQHPKRGAEYVHH